MDISRFIGEEQDEGFVRKIVDKVADLLTAEERIEYVAVQKNLVVTISPDAIVLTGRRFILVKPGLLGMTFHDVPWREVHDVHMSEQMIGATLVCRTTAGAVLSLDKVPKKQARRVYAYAQKVEEEAYEKRRQMELDTLRAGAGGVVLQAPAVAPVAAPVAPVAEDPLAALSKLKQLRDAELITAEEFEGKKAEILARL
jgi:hypothetical protein